MVRSFSERPVDPALLDRLLDDALRAPTAGNTGGVSWLTLVGPEQTAVFWDHTTTAEWRRDSPRWHGLSRVPVVALSLCSPAAYVARYGEPDKEGSGLGPEAGADAWPIPYWFGDAGFSAMVVLLGAHAQGLGACFLGTFRGERTLLEVLGVPTEWRLFGAVVLGHPDGADTPSPSLARTVDRRARVHRGRW